MSAAYLHLMINHVPVVGAFLALPLLALALWTRERGAVAAAALVLALSGAGAGGALWTGEPAEEQVEHLAGTSEPAIEIHEERAEVATILAVLAGLAGLAVAAAGARGGRSALLGVTALAAASAGAMAWTAQSGGPIRHSELRDDAATAPETPEHTDRVDHDAG